MEKDAIADSLGSEVGGDVGKVEGGWSWRAGAGAGCEDEREGSEAYGCQEVSGSDSWAQGGHRAGVFSLALWVECEGAGAGNRL